MTLQGGWIQKPNKMMIWDYGHGLLVYYTMTEPQKMELYDLQGNMLLQGKSYQSVKIIDEDLVLCKKDDSTPPKLFWSDGTSIMSEYYVEQGQIINDNIISTSIWINGEILIGILDKENPEQWIIAPRYERILFTNYDTVEGIVVNYEKSTNDTVTFHCETFDMQGNILSVSEEITLSYDAYKEFCS
ncbi:MAG: hypothetical protein KAQ68_08355, partial [Clostridiales bacterium]|nr:hypothetical protein [Clostridiales bacterium]